MPIPWDKLFELLFKMLEDCGAESPNDRQALLREYPGRAYFAIRRALRSKDGGGFRGKDLRKATAEVWGAYQSAEPNEVKAFCKGDF